MKKNTKEINKLMKTAYVFVQKCAKKAIEEIIKLFKISLIIIKYLFSFIILMLPISILCLIVSCLQAYGEIYNDFGSKTLVYTISKLIEVALLSVLFGIIMNKGSSIVKTTVSKLEELKN